MGDVEKITLNGYYINSTHGRAHCKLVFEHIGETCECADHTLILGVRAKLAKYSALYCAVRCEHLLWRMQIDSSRCNLFAIFTLYSMRVDSKGDSLCTIEYTP